MQYDGLLMWTKVQSSDLFSYIALSKELVPMHEYGKKETYMERKSKFLLYRCLGCLERTWTVHYGQTMVHNIESNL